jgi:benzoate membrane transport protein
LAVWRFFFSATAPGEISFALPQLAYPSMDCSLAAFVAVSLPMIILAMGLGNVQGLGFLIAQEYPVPVTRITVLTGVNSIVNALLGGHAATVARTGAAILVGPEAGPKEGRYWAAMIAAVLTVTIALGAGTLTPLLMALPRTFVVTLDQDRVGEAEGSDAVGNLSNLRF